MRSFYNTDSKVSDLLNQTEVLKSFPSDANNYSHLGITDIRLFKYQKWFLTITEEQIIQDWNPGGNILCYWLKGESSVRLIPDMEVTKRYFIMKTKNPDMYSFLYNFVYSELGVRQPFKVFHKSLKCINKYTIEIWQVRGVYVTDFQAGIADHWYLI